MTTVASLTDVTKAYGSKIVLDAVNLQIQEGEILALLGPNGSGKSTILKILAFIENPTDGEVTFQGEKVNFKNTENSCLPKNNSFQHFSLQQHCVRLEIAKSSKGNA